METQIIEGNELIARFMGGEIKKIPVTLPAFMKDHVYAWTLSEGTGHLDGLRHYDNFMELQYHTSWDWLMPVVEKIETMVIKTNITSNIILIRVNGDVDNDIAIPWKANKLTKIDGVWQAVVQFITWHNNQ